jgi:hypothetical protein
MITFIVIILNIKITIFNKTDSVIDCNADTNNNNDKKNNNNNNNKIDVEKKYDNEVEK